MAAFEAPLLSSSQILPIITAADAKASDAITIANGTPSFTLMRRAGRAVVDLAQRLLPRTFGTTPHVTVVCGTGNNGGDGFVAAHYLALCGYATRVILCGDAVHCSLDSQAAQALYDAPALPYSAHVLADALNAADLVIDALFGTGLSRPLAGDALAIVTALNAWQVRTKNLLVSIDVPSGIDADTGAVLGGAVCATHTLALYALKRGHVLLPGMAHCGEMSLNDLAMEQPAAVLLKAGSPVVLNTPALWQALLPRPTMQAHKYSRGSVLVLAGSAYQSGAARLSARSALRMGAGIVSLACRTQDSIIVNANHCDAVMVKSVIAMADFAAMLDDPRLTALVLGPGAGVDASTRECVALTLTRPPVKEIPPALVLDADALSCFAGDATSLKKLLDIGRGQNPHRAIIITPHEGEFVRLFEGVDDVIKAPCKITRTQAAARYVGVHVLCKGADTVITSPDGACFCHLGLSPWLATAGSGDVLAGIIAGLLAQGMALPLAACAASSIHSACATKFGAGLISEDLVDAIPTVLHALL